MKFISGDVLPTTVMEAVNGEAINLPDPKSLDHDVGSLEEPPKSSAVAFKVERSFGPSASGSGARLKNIGSRCG